MLKQSAVVTTPVSSLHDHPMLMMARHALQSCQEASPCAKSFTEKTACICRAGCWHGANYTAGSQFHRKLGAQRRVPHLRKSASAVQLWKPGWQLCSILVRRACCGIHHNDAFCEGGKTNQTCGNDGRSATYIAPSGGNISIIAASITRPSLSLIA